MRRLSQIATVRADIDNTLISNNISSGKKKHKYFIEFRDINYKTKSLCIMLPKRSAYVKRYNGKTKWMYFLIEDNELLKKYKGIWNRVSNKKNLIAKPSTMKNF